MCYNYYGDNMEMLEVKCNKCKNKMEVESTRKRVKCDKCGKFIIVDKDEEEIERLTNKAKRDMFMEYVPLLIILFFILIIRAFICTPVRVNGTSMVPTLNDGDYMLLYKLKKRATGIKRFDIVVIKTDSGLLIKRVIGLPGEHVRYEIKNENNKEVAYLYINNKVVEETMLSEEYRNQTCVYDYDLCKDGITVGDNEYFVMGDNRGNSKDSRLLGNINDKEISGIAEVILFPFNRIGTVK